MSTDRNEVPDIPESAEVVILGKISANITCTAKLSMLLGHGPLLCLDVYQEKLSPDMW